MAWTPTTNIRGAQGVKGDTGDTGPAGTASPTIVSIGNVANGGTITIASAAHGATYRATATGAGLTLGVPGGAVEGETINVEVSASVATTLTIHASITRTTGLASTLGIAVGKCGYLGLRYRGSAWRLLAATVDL